ncbi:hypothetical protein [Streptomyces xanthophaeus]|uniref:hypothetical protein n=1 Tax=Streptomyces xanthophaeus TaxID=67385 RepID=UPI000A52AC49|nr:hypothetical protein [Streptomyces xanthophaeus]
MGNDAVRRRFRNTEQRWGSFVYFSDPDGNGWAVQQTTPRTSPGARDGEQPT